MGLAPNITQPGGRGHKRLERRAPHRRRHPVVIDGIGKALPIDGLVVEGDVSPRSTFMPMMSAGGVEGGLLRSPPARAVVAIALSPLQGPVSEVIARTHPKSLDHMAESFTPFAAASAEN